MPSRRHFLTGIIAAAAAPAVIRTPGLLMPIKSLRRAVAMVPPQYAMSHSIVLMQKVWWDYHGKLHVEQVGINELYPEMLARMT